MPATYYEFGVLLESQSIDALKVETAINIFSAVEDSNFSDLIEIRRIEKKGDESEIIVIEIECDGVPSKSRTGIQYRERLALRFFEDNERLPEVRALRQDFPVTYHQNHVLKDEPASLCIYLEPWKSVKRTWTPQKHLQNIATWLEKTADEALHTDGQPLEPLFFENSQYRLILPVDFSEKVGNSDWCLVPDRFVHYEGSADTLTGVFIPLKEAATKNEQSLHAVAIELQPVVHGEIERTPLTLGQLYTSLLYRGADLEELLYEEIRIISEGDGLAKSSVDKALLVLSIPLLRYAKGVVERVQIRGFILHVSLTQLGSQCGILRNNEEEGDDRFYFSYNLVSPGRFSSDDWKSITLEPVEILNPFTRDTARRFSDIECDIFSGVLAGVGALGSAVHNIWAREGWGEWSLVDPDIINPHNLARHSAFAWQIGIRKVEAVKELEHAIYSSEKDTTELHFGEASSDVPSIRKAQLIVDMTTSLYIPRDLAATDDIARSVSAFITPSGLTSVLMIEDESRKIRLDALEAQYYTAVLRSDWGATHLLGHSGSIWVGAGCRDMAMVIPTDLVQLHASILARHIRLKSMMDEASLLTWCAENETGEVTLNQIPVSQVNMVDLNGFTIVCSSELMEKVRSMRINKLPNETGGILLGYFDIELSRIYIVDICSAPSNSVEESTGFERGDKGLEEIVNQARGRTANVVSYIGEWHSHPEGASTTPSMHDIKLLRHLAIELNNDGLPALMLIVGDDSENWLLGKCV